MRLYFLFIFFPFLLPPNFSCIIYYLYYIILRKIILSFLVTGNHVDILSNQFLSLKKYFGPQLLKKKIEE